MILGKHKLHWGLKKNKIHIKCMGLGIYIRIQFKSFYVKMICSKRVLLGHES